MQKGKNVIYRKTRSNSVGQKDKHLGACESESENVEEKLVRL